MHGKGSWLGNNYSQVSDTWTLQSLITRTPRGFSVNSSLGWDFFYLYFLPKVVSTPRWVDIFKNSLFSCLQLLLWLSLWFGFIYHLLTLIFSSLLPPNPPVCHVFVITPWTVQSSVIFNKEDLTQEKRIIEYTRIGPSSFPSPLLRFPLIFSSLQQV